MRNHRASILLLCLFYAAAGWGCTGHFLPGAKSAPVIQGDGFVIVTVTAQDTPASLAQTYLGSRDKASWIADYHRIGTLTPGQQLVIPQHMLVYGGVHANGFQTVPVLFYPRIDPDAESAQGTTAAAFEQHMHYLRANGYVTVTLDRLHAFFNLEDQLPSKAVVITFDSADRWVYDIAFPILERHGHIAAIFVPTDKIGNPGRVQWNELADMAAKGFDIGASGSGSRVLTDIPADSSADLYLKVVEDEIRLARQLIEDHLTLPCLYFAYPEGQTNDLIIGLLKQYGYRLAFTRHSGDNPFFVNTFKVHRAAIDPQTDVDRIRQMLTTFVPAELQ
jgi:peptidoglycan/xylan/chitin deacetylase (PgdA/CDA1 family)